MSGDTRSVQEIIEQGLKPSPLYNTLDGLTPPELVVVHELVHLMGGLSDFSLWQAVLQWLHTNVNPQCSLAAGQSHIRINDDVDDKKEGAYTFKAAQKRKLNGKSLTTAANYEFLVKGNQPLVERQAF